MNKSIKQNLLTLWNKETHCACGDCQAARRQAEQRRSQIRQSALAQQPVAEAPPKSGDWDLREQPYLGSTGRERDAR